MCMICTCEFTLTWRRHHCRACGKVTPAAATPAPTACYLFSSSSHHINIVCLIGGVSGVLCQQVLPGVLEEPASACVWSLLCQVTGEQWVTTSLVFCHVQSLILEGGAAASSCIVRAVRTTRTYSVTGFCHIFHSGEWFCWAQQVHIFNSNSATLLSILLYYLWLFTKNSRFRG